MATSVPSTPPAWPSSGHDVVGIDVIEAQVAALAEGRAPFHEPGLPELLAEALATGRLRFSTDAAEAAGAEVHFVCVGTPQKRGENAADLRYVQAAVDDLLPHLSPGDVVVGKSTVPVGTAERHRRPAARGRPRGHPALEPRVPARGPRGRGHPAPRPLRVRRARPATAARGPSPGSTRSTPWRSADGTPKLVTDLATAQLVKVAANSFLATKISFINAMAELCEVTGADVTQLADAIGLDDRIGRRFLNAGLGFGGGCLPKDIRAFMARAGELGADQALSFLREVDAINMRRRVRMVDLAREELRRLDRAARGSPSSAPRSSRDSDDVRDSPALSVAAQMQLQGASVTVTDPWAVPTRARSGPT